MCPATRTLAGITIAVTLVGLAPAPAAADSRCYRHTRGERRLARRINRSRAHNGRRRLRLDPELSRVATKHSKAMANNRVLFHTASNVLGWRVTRWRRLGETVAVARRIRRIHRMFMRSWAHRSILLDRGYRHFGVGLAWAGGRRWVTVVVEARRDPGTRLSMPKCRR